LLRNHECAKLGSDEKDLPTPWDFWNLSSDFFRNSSF
jgi:hypothetical protein